MAGGLGAVITLRQKIKAIINDRTNANNIVDIIEQLDSNDASVVLQCIEGLSKIFTVYVKLGECSPISGKSKCKKKNKETAEEPEEVFYCWLNHNYSVAVKKILKLLQCTSNQNIQEQSLTALMAFVQAESEKLRENRHGYIFPGELFLRIMSHLTDGSSNMEYVIKLFKQYLQFTDICYYVLRNLSRIVSRFIELDIQSIKCKVHFSRNVFHFIRQVSIPQSEDDMGYLFSVADENGDLAGEVKSLDHSVNNLLSHKKVFSSAWIAFLSLPLDADIHRRVLVNLHEKVMPYLLNPKVLMDFLTDSYNTGGITSILSLNSLFVLVNQYNLDYPDFYRKLYGLFNVDIFHVKYQGRFFHLADLFLTSTHLPAYIVAAFIKRLSRLALHAPSSSVALITTFVGNLIRRHPNCKILIHRKKSSNLATKELEETTDMLTDPFIEDEPDLDKCQALQSSLWELETLRNHFYPGTKSLIELFEKPIIRSETDLSEHFDTSYESLFDDGCIEITKNNAFVEFHVPKGLLSDAMNELWC